MGVKRTGWIKIDSETYNMDWFASVTEKKALMIHGKTKFSQSRIKKVWKIANGLTVPNYLKEELETKNGSNSNKSVKKPKKKDKPSEKED